MMLAAMLAWANPVHGHHEAGLNVNAGRPQLKINQGRKVAGGMVMKRRYTLPSASVTEEKGTSNASLDSGAMYIDIRELMARRIMAPFEVATVCEQMDAMWLDYEKLEWAKKSLHTRNITTGDLVNMLAKVGFEEFKLDLAKYAYTRVINKGDYVDIMTLFEFNSTRKELEQYIKEH